MEVFTISYNGMTKVYTTREAVDVAVCVRNGIVESAVATGNVTLDVYDCDDPDLVEDDADGQPQTAGERAQADFEALAGSPEYLTVY